MTTYSLGDAARILRVSPARLRYWKRTELVKSREEGVRPAFEFRDLVCIRAVLSLLDQGVPLRRIRRAVEVLRERVPDLDDPINALRVWADGSERMVIEHSGGLLEPSGQMVLDFRGSSDSGDEVLALQALQGDRGEDPATKRDRALALFEQGCALDSDRRTYDQAIEVYGRSIDADPSLADSHCNIGAVFYNQGKRERARECFERCLELDPRHVEGHFNLANVLEEKGANDMALRHYRAALQADPLYADVHINLALVYERLGRAPRAREHWRRYLQLEADGAWAEVARHRLDS